MEVENQVQGVRWPAVIVVVLAAVAGGCASLVETGAQPGEKGHENNVVNRDFQGGSTDYTVDYAVRSVQRFMFPSATHLSLSALL